MYYTMKFIDYFFYKIYCFLRRLKKDEGDSKWSAFLYLSTFMGFFLISMNCLIGLLYDNSISALIKINPFGFSLIIVLFCLFLLAIRYYKFKNISDIENAYLNRGRTKRIIVDVLIYITMIVIPISTFYLFRLYTMGHI